ncbi:MAG TPA: RecX family transcriptional regulator [Allosphingosinicella sp.]|uniref:regulatory protein RecX n=1 Tax=Allosphingosinicella sp. TaxID=2823234 RepID=UPI002F280614
MKSDRHRKARPPLDRGGLERLALHYAGRYATTRAKLTAYLVRKLRERGWTEEREPPLDSLVERFTELGYVDDQAFASARAASLQRRGYGGRRIDQALKAAGIDEEDSAPIRAAAEDGAWAAALRFAERKRIGPYAAEPLDRPARERAFAAMVRAGHQMDTIRRVLDAAPGEIPNPDNM